MNSWGRFIFFDKSTGDVLIDTGDKITAAPYRDHNYYISRYRVLTERNRETFDYIELEYGQYSQDFIESQGNYSVNPETKELEFSYPDPNEPEEPQPYQPPLSEKVAQLENENIINMVTMTEMYESKLQLEQEHINTMIALTELYEFVLGGN